MAVKIIPKKLVNVVSEYSGIVIIIVIVSCIIIVSIVKI